MKYILTFLLIAFSGMTHMLQATSQRVTYLSGTYCTELYFHRDVELISSHLTLRLLKIKEIEYINTYYIQVNEEWVENPLLYIQLAISRWGEYMSNPFATGNVTLKVDGTMLNVHAQSIDFFIDEKWNEIHTQYKNIDSLLCREIREVNYLPLSLEKGRHTITVQYKAYPDIDFSSIWNNYIYYYHIPQGVFPSEKLTVEILMEDKKGIWSFEGNQITGNIKKEYRAGELSGESIRIAVKAPKPLLVKWIYNITPFVLFWISALLLVLLHGWKIVKYRKNHRTPKISKVAWLGAIVVCILQFIIIPFLFCKTYTLLATHGSCSFDDLEWVILIVAGVFIMGLYIPVAMLFDYVVKQLSPLERG